MEIKRDKYLNDLKDRMHNGMIKVVTGIRRSGKSYLIFSIFKEYLISEGVDEEHIIEMEFDKKENSKYRDPDDLLDYIKEHITDKGEYYVLLDEVQMLEDFEEVLNSLLHIKNLDIYVTGSNSRFLSSDVLTEFRGRGDEIHVYPLTFQEAMQNYKGDIYHGWAEYVTYGGLPLVWGMRTDQQKIKYLTDLFEKTYISDIIEHNGIEKTEELETLLNVLASAVGSLTNPTKIEATFKSVLKSTISRNTVVQYLGYLKDAFIINEANRYDVKGRKYIGTPLKYYYEDIGLRNARLGFRQVEETHLMENVVYNELLSRGYAVDVGVVETRKRNSEGKQEKRKLEIDFVANMGSQRYYIQSAFQIPDQEKEKQEKESLNNVDDSFKKIVLVRDVVKISRDEKGIVTMSIYDFLMDKNSLEKC
ncbi:MULTISPECIES: ATP-binding protein [Eubacterium]|uniref:ATP-binding protein n=1 Tax=Eubacterium TaxID=1730 RepID=UPI00247951F9|nr:MULTISPECIES: ATP-binding protein [Eubacterium]MCR5368951.1 ATP-binding protein [Eubacterium sp.]